MQSSCITSLSTSTNDLPWDIETSDLAWMKREIGGLLKPFALEAHSRHSYRARLLYRRLRRTGLAVIDYGGEVEVNAGRMNRCYLLQIPLTGSYVSQGGERALTVHGRCAHIVYPGMPLNMHWSSDCRVLVFRFEEADMLGGRVNPWRRLSGTSGGELLALDSEPNHSLSRIVEYVTREATGGSLFKRAPHITAHAESLLLSGLLEALDGGESDELRQTTPRYVQRAKRYLLDHATETPTIAEVARASSTTPRTLYDGFQRSHGVGPIGWLRAHRLERARDELLRSQPGSARVTDIAMHWGFQHLGRFCQAYKNRFGETPTATLHRQD